MAKIEIEKGELVVQMEGTLEKLMALKSSLRIPAGHVTGVRAHPLELRDETFIFRVFGASFSQTHIGYFWKKGEGLVFCDCHDMSEILAVDLKDERMKHLYIQVTGESADAALNRISSNWRDAGLQEIKTEVFPMSSRLPENSIPVV